MAKPKKTERAVSRRGFLTGVATAAAGAAALTRVPGADVEAAQRGDPPRRAPSPAQIERDAGNVRPPRAPSARRARGRPSGIGSDGPGPEGSRRRVRGGESGSSFEGLQESIINYGNPPNTMPELITALHEESAVTMAHGMARRRASRCARCCMARSECSTPRCRSIRRITTARRSLLIAGRDLGFIAAHSANDMAGMVRSFTKWDAQPKTLAESLTAHSARLQRGDHAAVRSDAGRGRYRAAEGRGRRPAGPDVHAARHRRHRCRLRRARSRKALVDAQNPRIAVGRLRTPEGVRLAVQLAELVGASTSTQRDAGTDELSAASSALRSRREHNVRLHARSRSARRAGLARRSCAGDAA